MRDFLRRGKSIDNEKWVYGNIVFTRSGRAFLLEGSFFSGESHEGDFKHGEIYGTEVIPETVGQFTGLTDRNGNKIFEGDIFKFPDEAWESSYTPCGTEWDSWGIENYGVVGFDEYTARFDFIQYKYNENSVEADLHENNNIEFADFVKELEIFGNIHDNKEILNVK